MSYSGNKVESFQSRDTFLAILLGLVSTSELLDAMLDRVKKEAAEHDPRLLFPHEAHKSIQLEDETALLALLGIVSVHRQLKTIFLNIRNAAVEEEPEIVRSAPAAPNDCSERFMR